MDSFKIGDRVIYPNQGLGIIEDIQEEDYFGEKFKIYRLRILGNNALILVPSTNTKEIGIRKLISEESIEEIFSYMRNGRVDVTMNWKGRYKENVNLMRSGTIFDLVNVLKTLYYLSLIKPLSFREKKMMEKAKQLIISEIAEVSSLPATIIEARIDKTLALCFKNAKPRVES